MYNPLLLLSIVPVYRAVLVNRTIDSNKGDPETGFMPIYQPQSPWADQTCSGCYIQPDTALAYDGTWNAATYNPGLGSVNITLQFTGVSIWVFFILSNANSHGPATTTNTQVNITLDGQYAGNFSHNPDMTIEDMIYNATIFSAYGLTNTSHKVVIATNDYPNNTFMNFDWAMYTADVDTLTTLTQSTVSSSITTTAASTPSSSSSSSTPSNSSSANIGMIVGPTLGGVVLVALVLILLFRRFRRPPAVRNEKIEGILNIDAPPPHRNTETSWLDLSVPSVSQSPRFPPIPSFSSPRTHSSPPAPTTKRRAATMSREWETVRRIVPSVQQREMADMMDGPRPIRNARSAGDIMGLGGPSDASSASQQPRHMQDIAALLNEVQQLRDEIGYISQRGSDTSLPLGSTSAPLRLPPAYTRR